MFSEIYLVLSQEVQWKFFKPCTSSREHNLSKGASMYTHSF